MITGGATGFALNATNVYGDFINNGAISGDGENTGVHLTAELFDGDFTNGGTIESAYNALRLDFGTFDGSFSNTGTIAGGSNGAMLMLGSMTGDLTNAGSIGGETGDGVAIEVGTWGSDEDVALIVNTSDGIISGGATGFDLLSETIVASVTNDGVISGGVNGVVFEVTNFNAPVANNGTISGGTNGLVMVLAQANGGFTNAGDITGDSGTGVSITATNWGTEEDRADIINTSAGVITGGATGFYLNATNVYGDFLNDGSISGDGENTGVHLIADLFNGNVTNDGAIESAYNALRLDFGTFDGSFSNTSTIAGGANGAILALGTMTGGFTNSGNISGATGNGVSITATNWGAADARADIVNTATGVISGGATGFYLNATNVYGDFLNDGSISGDAENTGVHLVAELFDGNVTNGGTIESAYNALRLDFGTLDGAFSNTGTIAGGANGAILALGTMTGGFTNSGNISGTTGDGVSITATNWGAADARADIVNTSSGIISGGATGFYLNATNVYGDFLNDGSISGDGENTGVHLVAELFEGDVTNNGAVESAVNALRLDFGTFDGSFSNTSTIAGGANGAILALGTMTGGFTNSGGIAGAIGNGVSITATNWGAAEARADIVNTSTGVITGGATGFYLNATNVYGDFLNDGSISGNAENTGVHLTAELFDGNFTNNNSIESAYNAVRLDFGTFDGAFSNTGTIAGGANGAILALGTMTGGFTNSGNISGATGNGVSITATNWGAADARADIVNTSSGVITGGATGFYLNATNVYGDFLNDGSITGDGENTGVHLVAELFEGDVTNNGAVESAVNALRLDFGTFDGSFANTSTIAGGANGAILALGTMTGDFSNSGAIGGTSGNGVAIEVGAWGSADDLAAILNAVDGEISGGATGFELTAETLLASVTNDGAISGGQNGVVMVLGSAQGGFTNTGEITGESDAGVSITATTWGAADARADIVNTSTGVITGGATGFALNATSVYGDFLNDGSISGDGENTGVYLSAEFDGDVTNNGAVESAVNALRLDFGTFDGSFANTSTIAGGANGAIFALGSMTGDFTNSGSIGGETGDGVAIEVGTWGSDEDVALIVNTIDGSISGGATGFDILGETIVASVTNDGVISGGVNGVVFEVTNFNAPVANNGTISGGTNGLVMVLAQANGGFTNAGDITGDSGTGVSITATNWGSEEDRADIVNTSAGAITGGTTGFELVATNVYGDFINDGTITGGGSETGTHIVADLYDGDVINNGVTEAVSNALHLEIGTLNGVVRNTGTIEATDLPGTAVLLQIGNGAEFTNADGGLILGDAVFAGNAAYAFIGEDGGIEGSLTGEGFEGNDDTIAVRGTHYFVGGTASNFASFTVENGGTALMGARSEGGESAGGYGFANVDALTVENGGLLYIDRSVVLEVGTYTQEAGGVTEFFLGAPDGFAGLTGDVTAGEGDYGRIVVSGVATLDGTVAGFLDPLFDSANADLTSVRYEDVIEAGGGINGGFTTVALIAQSSLFEMNPEVDGNTIDVVVARTSLNDVSDVPGIIVNLGGPFDAMVSDRSNGVGSSSCGLASSEGGWCFNRFAQNDATQTMTDASPEDPFDWLKTGHRNVGEAAVWGRAIGAWGESDGWNGSKGSKFELAGAIVGADYVFDQDVMAGLAVQWTTTDVDFRGRPDNADVQNFELGAYTSLGDTRLYLNANASAIWHSVETNRFSNGGGRARGEYSGMTLSGFAEGGKIFETEEGMRIGPFVSLSLTHLETDAYREKGTGPLLFVRDAELDSLKGTAGVRLGYPIQLESGRKVVPELRLAWTHEFMDNQASFLASVQGQPGAPGVILGEKYARDTVLVGTGVTVPLSDSTNLYIDYDAGLNPDITTHTLSAGLRMTW